MNLEILKNTYIVTSIIGITLIAGCSTKPSDMESRVDLVKQSVTYDMKDPMSTEYRNVRVFNNQDPKRSLVCGELNSKNSYGAYVGFKRFIADYDSNFILEGNPLRKPPESLKPAAPLDTTPLDQSSYDSARELAATELRTKIYGSQADLLNKALDNGETVEMRSFHLSTEKQLGEVDAAANAVVFEEYWSRLCKA